MSFDVLIRGATVVGAGVQRRLDVGVADGLIAALGPELAGPATEEIDAAGLHLLPGVVDAHVHFNEPGRADWEGFETGTRALAVGGATAAIDMPLNSHPPTVTGAAFDEKRRCLERSALVDIALWGGLVPGGVEAMDELGARGVVGFKAFMCSSGIDDFPGVDDLTLYDGMCRAASLGLPVAVHAESEAITAGLAQRARAARRTACATSSRPGRRLPSSRRSRARSSLRRRAAARCTWFMFRRATASPGSSPHAPAVSTSAVRPARTTWCSPRKTPRASATSRSARRRSTAPRAREPVGRARRRHAADGRVGPLTGARSLKSGDDSFDAWGGISGCSPCSRCCSPRAPVRAG